MSFNQLISAIKGTETTPCELHSCSESQRCAQENLACSSFVKYIHTGRAESPFIFFPQRKGKGKKPLTLNRVRPTKALYQSAFKEATSSGHEREKEILTIISSGLSSRSSLELAWGS